MRANAQRALSSDKSMSSAASSNEDPSSSVYAMRPARLSLESPSPRNDAVGNPRAVRYAWADDPDGNLVNRIRLPASPFRR